uniref:Uncharacterized protein n=1 Tax=Octopus bimaculoides TaxID=37653 RepID=A0A0L8FN65_OCTBM
MKKTTLNRNSNLLPLGCIQFSNFKHINTLYDHVISIGRRYATVEVRFTTEEEAIKHSTEAIRTAEWVLLPSYCGKRVAKVRVSKVPSELKL